MHATPPSAGQRAGRRDFCRALCGLAAAALTARTLAAAAPRLKIGITGLIWGATPRTPDRLAQAVAEMAGLGYHCFETWGSVMQALDEKGALAPLSGAAGDSLPLRLHGRQRA